MFPHSCWSSHLSPPETYRKLKNERNELGSELFYFQVGFRRIIKNPRYFRFKNKTISNVQSLPQKILNVRNGFRARIKSGWNCKIVSYNCKVSERSKGVYPRPFQTDNKPPKDLKEISQRHSPLNNETFKNQRNIFPQKAQGREEFMSNTFVRVTFAWWNTVYIYRENLLKSLKELHQI